MALYQVSYLYPFYLLFGLICRVTKLIVKLSKATLCEGIALTKRIGGPPMVEHWSLSGV